MAATRKSKKRAVKKATPRSRPVAPRIRKSAATRKSPRRPKVGPVASVLVKATQVLEDVPKGIAVALAVAHQLTVEGRWPPNDVNRTMTSYRYDINSLTNFLRDVKATLLSGQPSYEFTFDAAFVLAGLPQTVGELTGSINDKTSRRQAA